MFSVIHIWARTVLLKSVLPGNAVKGVAQSVRVGSLDTVTVTGSDVVRLPAASRAIAVSVCEPLLEPVVFQETAYGAVVSSTPDAPSIRNSTPITPTLSEASALIVIVPTTVLPAAGEVMETVGGAQSEPSFDTVTATGLEVVAFPAASRAVAVSVCEPLPAVVVSHGTE